MKLLHDRAAMMRTQADTSDPALTQIIGKRIAALSQGEFNLIDATEILVVEQGDTEADIIREVGFSPLVDPVDGIRFGSPGFQPFWDWLIGHPGWWEMSVSFGSTFAYILFIQSADGIEPELAALCAHYTR